MGGLGIARGLLCCIALGAPAAALGQTVFSYVSEEGESIGGGGRGVLTPANAEITLTGDASDVTIRVDAHTGELWQVNLTAPRGQELQRGRYFDAERAPFRTGLSPGIDVSGRASGCNQAWGSFSIRQIETNPEGQVTALEASFLQSCQGADGPMLAGVASYKSSPLSFSVDAPQGGWFGEDLEKDYRGDTSTFALFGTPNEVTYGASGQRDDWMIWIKPPTGKTLREGRYWTTFQPDAQHAGFQFSYNSHGCSSKGSLEIVRMHVDPDGQVRNLWAKFSQRCNGGPPMIGTIHYKR